MMSKVPYDDVVINMIAKTVRVVTGHALRSDWRTILDGWMNELTTADCDRYRRLHTVLQRCLYEPDPVPATAPRTYVSTSRWPLP